MSSLKVHHLGRVEVRLGSHAVGSAKAGRAASIDVRTSIVGTFNIDLDQLNGAEECEAS